MSVVARVRRAPRRGEHGRSPSDLSPHRYMLPAHTQYPNAVVAVPGVPPKSGLFVLKEATTNKKLGSGGKRITKGRYRGMPLYSLTLEERATCWSGCQNWEGCYGSNMPFAKRYQPGKPLETALRADVQQLSKKHPAGFVVRLHVLGDFYSTGYVAHWFRLLLAYPALHLFGYTHWPADHSIGKAVAELVRYFPERAAFRRSDRTDQSDPLPGAMTIPKGALAVPGTVICPEQTGRTASCTTCGLCMNTTTAVSFIDHSRRALRVLPNAA